MTTALNLYVLVWACLIVVAHRVWPAASTKRSDALMAVAVALWPLTGFVIGINRLANHLARNDRGDR